MYTKNEDKSLHFFCVLKNENEIFHFCNSIFICQKKIFTLILIRCIVHFPNHIIASCVLLYSFKMAALADILSVEAVRDLVQNHTLKEVSNILQTEFPNQSGLSVKSIKRSYQAHGIAKRNIVTDDELDQIVESSVRQVNLIILWPSFVF